MSTHPNRRRLAAAAALIAGLATAALAPAATAAPTAGTVTGRVTSVDGLPLGGVSVDGVIPAGCDFAGCDAMVVGSAVTAANGTYRLRIDGVGPGDSVRLQFGAAAATGGTSATGYANRCFGGDDNCSYGTGKGFTHVPGRTITGIDVALRPAAEIRGRLTDAEDRGVGRLPVRLYRHEPDLEPDGTLPVGSTTSDVNGNYRFPQLAARQGWFVCFGDPAGASHVGTPSPEGYASTCTTAGVVTTSGRVATVDATLQYRGAIRGTVVDQLGQPIAGATVSITPPGQNGTGAQSSTTATNGTFRIGKLSPGTAAAICVAAPRFTDSCDYPPVTVRSGVTTSVGKLVLQRAT